MTLYATLLVVGWVCPRAEAAPFDGEFAALVANDGGALVLERMSVRAEVQVGLAVVDVTQVYRNPFDKPIDATYLFPLPSDAAVRAMTLTCGDRVLKGEILDRKAAQVRYDEAAAKGQRAGLLQQHRPNLFQQSVSAICPGETVTVDLQYVDPLVEEDGRTELVFPTTMGPRYKAGDVPEPPFTTVPQGSVSVEVVIAEGQPVDAVYSDSHVIELLEESLSQVRVRTAADDALPNKDFHLAWTFGGKGNRVSTLAVPPTAGRDGYLAVTLRPGIVEDLGQMRPRELLFVLDQSCSMRGEAHEASKATVRMALDQMRPTDTFDLVRFSNAASTLFPTPQPATPANIAAAKAWLEPFDGGGTEMTAGIVASLGMPRAKDANRLRLVLLLTDGYIGNDEEVMATVRKHLGSARLFSLGIGSSVNRYLLDALADMGRGDVSYQLPGTPVSETVARFYERIAHPALTDLAIAFEGIQVTEVYPSKIPDLFAGQPVRVVARYRGSAQNAKVWLTGLAGDENYAVNRPLALTSTDGGQSHEALPTLWARRKLADLERTHRSDPVAREALGAKVALAHHLVSPYTSLVAVDSGSNGCGPAVANVAVPSMVPAGVDPVSSGAIGIELGASGYGTGGGGMGEGLGSGMHAEKQEFIGRGSFGTKGAGGIGTIGGDPMILGSLDRTLIDEVIKRQMNQIRYCYQRELTKNAELGGKIVVKFTINPDGTVSSAVVKSSTVGSAAVETCITERFLKMQFPAPAGSGEIIVSYPFLFSPG